mgnify:CR=1 FL=1
MLGAWLLLLGRTVTADLSTQGVVGRGSSDVASVQAQPPSIVDVGRGDVSARFVHCQTALDASGRGVVSSSQRVDASAQSMSGLGTIASSVEIGISTTNLNGRSSCSSAFIDSAVASAAAAGSGAVEVAPRVNVDLQSLIGRGSVDAAACHALFAASTSVGQGRVEQDTIFVEYSTTIAGHALIASSNILISTAPYSVRGLGTLASIIDVVLGTSFVSGRGTSSNGLITITPPSVITGAGAVATANVVSLVQTANASGTALIRAVLSACVPQTSVVGAGDVRATINIDVASQNIVAVGRTFGLPLVFMPTTTGVGHGVVVVEITPPPSTLIICQTLVTYPVERGLMSVGINDVAVMQITLNDSSTITVGLVPRQTIKTPAC